MPDLTGQFLQNRYRVDALLGRGGMAEVYKAWDSKRAVFVAVKLLNGDLAEDYVFVRRFMREAEALELLDHPHIVRFLGFEQARGIAFMVMEYIEGVTLRRYLHLLNRPLSVAETLGILRPVSSALHYAHQMGIFHCDVKPANIFLEKSGRVVMGDFGIARLSESATVTFSTPGTPAYMSPEQCMGGIDVDARSDVYSLGVTAYEMLTLDRPFKGETQETSGTRGERVRWEQMHADPPPLREINPEIPESVGNIVLHALEKEPAERYPDVISFYAAFHRASAATPVDVLPEVIAKLEQESQEISTIQEPAKVTGIESRAKASPFAQTVKPKWQAGLAVVATGLIFVIVLGLFLIRVRPDEVETTPIVTPATEVPIIQTPVPIPSPTSLNVLPPTETLPPEPIPTATLQPSTIHILYILNASNSMIEEIIAGTKKLDMVCSGLTKHFSSPDFPSLNIGLLTFGNKELWKSDTSCTSKNIDLPVSISLGSQQSIIDNLPLLKSAIGYPPIAEALRAAYKEFQSVPQDHTKAMILIDDGQHYCNDKPLETVTLNQSIGLRIPIYIVHITNADNDEVLEKLAHDTKGIYRIVSDEKKLSEYLEEFLTEIQSH